MAALDFPNAPINGTQYTAPNGAVYTYDGAAWTVSGVISTGTAAGGDLQGTYPNPTIKPTSLPWSVSGATLTPTDPAKAVALAPIQLPIVWGTATRKTRLLEDGAGSAHWRWNATLSAIDDVTKPAWTVALETTDDLAVYRAPAASTPTWTQLLRLESSGFLWQYSDGSACRQYLTAAGTATGAVWSGRNSRGTIAAPTPSLSADVLAQLSGVGCPTSGTYSEQALLKFSATENWTNTARGTQFLVNTTPTGAAALGGTSYLLLDGAGNLTIGGSTATKASGTTWANPSDRRIKKNIAPYVRGLAAILALKPSTFEFNGLGGSQDGLASIGLIADDVQPVMPEMVSTTPTRLTPDDAEPIDLLTLDTSALVLALVNAVQELTARVVALEAARA